MVCNLGGTDSVAHSELTSLALCYLIVWPLGVPLLFFAITFWQRHALHSMQPTEWSLATSIIHKEYTHNAFYWESFELLRRLTLCGFLLLIPRTLGFIQLIVAILFCFISFTVLLLYQPYRRPHPHPQPSPSPLA